MEYRIREALGGYYPDEYDENKRFFFKAYYGALAEIENRKSRMNKAQSIGRRGGH